MDKAQLMRFLAAIAMNESTGGQNTDHREINTGMHAGDTAIGQYGLLPNTAKEVLNRMRLEGKLPENLKPLMNKSNPELEQEIGSHPEYEQPLAEHLANHVLNKQNGDEEKAAYAWKFGHNLSPERIQKKNYKDSGYVQKYNFYRNLKDSQNNITDNTNTEGDDNNGME